MTQFQLEALKMIARAQTLEGAREIASLLLLENSLTSKVVIRFTLRGERPVRIAKELRTLIPNLSLKEAMDWIDGVSSREVTGDLAVSIEKIALQYGATTSRS